MGNRYQIVINRGRGESGMVPAMSDCIFCDITTGKGACPPGLLRR